MSEGSCQYDFKKPKSHKKKEDPSTIFLFDLTSSDSEEACDTTEEIPKTATPQSSKPAKDNEHAKKKPATIQRSIRSYGKIRKAPKMWEAVKNSKPSARVNKTSSTAEAKVKKTPSKPYVSVDKTSSTAETNLKKTPFKPSVRVGKSVKV